MFGHRTHATGSFDVPVTALLPDNARMLILFIILIFFILFSFGGGIARPAYRPHGISLGTILLIVLILWLFGVFGSRPF